MMSDPQIQHTGASDLLQETVILNPGPPAPRRSTIATFSAKPAFSPRPRFKTGNGQCTHLTMTRMYTAEFRCVLCLRTGPMGWIYRCTQDRELLIEDNMERGNEEKIDKLCDIFEKPASPRKRSPAARLSKLSILSEHSDKELHEYTGAQLTQLINQREKVLNLASQPASDTFQIEPLPPFSLATNTLFTSPEIIPSRTPPKIQKPWLPLTGGECQFKCCHFCRPTCADRAYLSLNGIANDDIPPTAITGFGFHLTKQRPVSLVKHVQNLGLRPNPPPHHPAHRKRLPHPTNPSLGLAIFSNTEAQPSSEVLASPYTPEYSPAVYTAFREMALRHPQPRRISSCPTSPETKTKLDSESEAEGGLEEYGEMEASMIPLPEQTQDEINVIGAPLTPMEELELDKGVFGSQPLEVSGGVAVMEESLGLHVADVVTQF